MVGEDHPQPQQLCLETKADLYDEYAWRNDVDSH